jgi:hypothetical protein
MSSAEPATAPAPAGAHVASEGLRRLRTWINAQGLNSQDPGQAIRDEFQRTALSATVRRMFFFGVESSLARYSARELLQFQLIISGEFAIYFARITWSRAVVEDDGPVLQALADSGMVDEQVAWTTQLPATAEGLTSEELHVWRLLQCRRDPSLFAVDWLWAISDELPRLGAAMVLAVLPQRPDCALSIGQWLQRHPAVLASVETDELLSTLVSVSAEHPQTTLAPFAGWYADRTVMAAAEWHLEHGEANAAIDLCRSLRPYGPCFEQAHLVAGLAACELGDVNRAQDIWRSMEAGVRADALHLRLASLRPALLSDEDVELLVRRIPADRPQSFFAAIKLLIERGSLATARAIGAQRGSEFPQPEIQALIAVLGGRS